MKNGQTVIIIPLNDPEAVLISQLAAAMKLPVIVSHQGHGASLDKSKSAVRKVLEGGYKQAVIIEMPGLKSEAILKKTGVQVIIIDHHNYTGLRRANYAKGRVKPSSLEQFLKLFRVTDKKIVQLGFDPKLVRGIGVIDRGFVWQAFKEGWSKVEVKKIMDYQDRLMAEVRDMAGEKEKIKAAEAAWKNRKEWNGFVIIENDTKLGLRARLSRIIAIEIGKPTPLILAEPKRGFIYVQETDRAQDLFKKFGGFTYGMGNNWGYRKEKGKRKVGLMEVRQYLK